MPRKPFDGRIQSYIKNKRPVVDGIRFDSESEAIRYGELSLRQRAGEISDLQVHPKMPLVVNGIAVTPSGKLTLDFKYRENGEWIFEDAKPADSRGRPMMTDVSKLKIAVCEACNGIRIRCVGVRKR